MMRSVSTPVVARDKDKLKIGCQSGGVIEEHFPFAADIGAFNRFSSHLHEHMRSVSGMDFQWMLQEAN